MDYLPILLMFILLVGGVAGLLIASRLIGPRRRVEAKASTYECGINPRLEGNPEEEQVPIKYAAIALLFLLFDVETAFLLPWAVLFRSRVEGGSVLGPLVFIGIFLFILLLGLFYAYRRNAFQWE